MPINKKNIPVLRPALFKDALIENTQDSIFSNLLLDDFFIHSFEKDIVKLKLPLPPHKKTVNDLVLILRGEMTKTIGLESFRLKAGQLLLTPGNSITTTKDVTEDLEGFYCHFSDQFLTDHPFVKHGLIQASVRGVLCPTAEEVESIKALFERLLSLYHRSAKRRSFRKLLHSYLSTLITELAVIAEESATRNSLHPLALKFGQLVSEHFKKSRKVKYYADLIHLSPNHLNKVIKKEMGVSASDVITQVCILESKVLLAQTNLNINEVALEMGFQDTSYFSRNFKKHTGVSPKQYRGMIDLS